MSKKNNYQQNQLLLKDPPKTLQDHPFYGLKLDPEQEIFRDMIWDPEKTVVICEARAGVGKAQPLDTLIPTPIGYRYLNEIKVGDFVFDQQGNPTKVLGVFPQGLQDVYKVTLSDGRSTLCGPEHLWTFTCDGCNNKFRTESLSKMLTRSIRTNNRASRYKIPNNMPVQYSMKEYPVDPYIVGLFLGDGCCLEDKLTFSSPEVEIVNEIAKLTNSYPVKYSDKNYSWCFKENGTNKLLKTDIFFKDIANYLINYSYNKRIPYEYLLGSIDQRFSLLQGLLDTDGSISYFDSRYNIRYTTTSYNLAMDIMQLAYSLGLSVSLVLDRRNYKYTTNNACYEISFRVPNEIKPHLFRKSRKREVALESVNFTKARKYDLNNIFSIEYLGYQTEMVCIYVDNPDHLYLTNDFIVTHNTVVAVGTANLLVQYGRYDGIIYVMSPTQEQTQGYLPGSIEEKSAPYMQPLIDAMNTLDISPYCLQTEDNIQGLKSGDAYIQFCTDTFMRGINLENKVIIVDECSNYYLNSLKKVLTRIHDSAKCIMIGSLVQSDIIRHKEREGFHIYLNAFKKEIETNGPHANRIGICELHTNHRGWFSEFCDNVEDPFEYH